MNKIVDWRIGEIKNIDDKFYQCVEHNNCYGCSLNDICTDIPISKKGHCALSKRKDRKSVIFKRLEKIGEPYMYYFPSGKIMCFQRYKLFNKLYSHNTEYVMCDFNKEDIVSIEVKQNKEDMKEKEPTYEELLHYYHSTVGLWAIDRSPQEVSLDWICDNAFQLGIDEKDSNSENIGKNLREFNLEAAKAGKPVCTRDGRKVRIICFDKKGCKRIVALVQADNELEVLFDYYSDGREFHSDTTDNDLMMLPEKKEGWVNIYNADTTFYYVDGRVFETKDEAVQEAKEEVKKEQREKNEYIDTIRLEWEE